MKNIITVFLLLVVPIMVYLVMNKRSQEQYALAQNSDLPTLITFSSTMCMDCQKMKGVIAEIEQDYIGRINFVSINALDKTKSVKDAVKKHEVVLVPTMIFLDDNGVQKNKIEGFIPKEQLIEEIEEIINE